MKLSKALKEKNKKAAEINQLLNKGIAANSYVTGTKQYTESKKVIPEAIAKLEDFIDFKTKLFNASAPIRSKIFQISEYRNLITRLKGMSTTEGMFVDPYARHRASATATTDLVYEVGYNEIEKDVLIKELEDKIDKLQEEIDYFNATTDL